MIVFQWYINTCTSLGVHLQSFNCTAMFQACKVYHRIMNPWSGRVLPNCSVQSKSSLFMKTVAINTYSFITITTWSSYCYNKLCIFFLNLLKTTRVPTTVPQLVSAPGLVPHHATSYTIHSDAALPLHASHHLTYSMMRGPSLGMSPALAMSTLSGKGRGTPAISNDLGPPIFMPCEYSNYRQRTTNY